MAATTLHTCRTNYALPQCGTQALRQAVLAEEEAQPHPTKNQKSGMHIYSPPLNRQASCLHTPTLCCLAYSQPKVQSRSPRLGVCCHGSYHSINTPQLL